MPEGPELHMSSQFINVICKGRIFSGKVRRNPIHKCADVVWDAAAYTITSVSRGKELKVFLQSLKTEADEKSYTEPGAKNEASERLHILFSFGMSGKFEFTSVSQLPKHAHLSFFTNAEPSMALSFVDYRRFGKWQVGADWSPDRGPCVLFEYPQFRSNVLNNLSNSAFSKPVCETLLNQKYFNGIGNYLRAEICYRAGIRPFDQARAVFSALSDAPEDVKVKTENEVKDMVTVKLKKERPDILELCNTIPLEVVGLGSSLYLPEDEDGDMSKFSLWLQCYYKSGMKNVADHNKRTMWYHGDPGPMLPREGGSRKRHGVYDKKLMKGGKKMKKEHGDVEKEPKGDINPKDVKKVAKSKKRDKQMPAIKPQRITRTLLKVQEDESTKTPGKATKSRKSASKKSSKAAHDPTTISGKKTPSRQARRRDKEMDGAMQSDAKDTKSKVERRATRAAVKRATPQKKLQQFSNSKN